MYTGNGATKKFLIPPEYDGSEVYLTFSTGRSIKMLEGEGYTISGGYAVFSAAVPAGVIVSFAEPEGYEAPVRNGYVVIYNDGRIVEVDEDPTEFLLRTQEILSEAKNHYDEVKSYAGEAITQIMGLKGKITDEFEGLLYEYSMRGQTVLTETADRLKGTIHTELESALLKIAQDAQAVDAGLQVMELTKKEVEGIAKTAAEEAKREVLSDGYEILEAYEDVKKLKNDYEYYLSEARGAAQKAGLEVQAAMNLKAEEELEMLRSLRTKLESDSENLNARINSAIEVMRGGINGR